MIIAIDGPAGSGKSSTARRIAERLGGFYLDTGAMYRAVGVVLSGGRVRLDREEDVADAVRRLHLDVRPDPYGTTLFVDGVDVTDAIRTTEAAEQASRVSKIPVVRHKLVDEQRRIGHRLSGDGHFVVVEGRDIGTVVFPDAGIKFFMDADPQVRARRRLRDMESTGEERDFAQVLSDIESRDRRDREREHSPLRQADDAIVVDTTALTPEQQVDIMIGEIAKRQADR